MVDQGDQGTSEENPPVWDGCIKPFKKHGDICHINSKFPDFFSINSMAMVPGKWGSVHSFQKLSMTGFEVMCKSTLSFRRLFCLHSFSKWLLLLLNCHPRFWFSKCSGNTHTHTLWPFLVIWAMQSTCARLLDTNFHYTGWLIRILIMVYYNPYNNWVV